MSSLHRRTGSPFWHCAFIDADGTRRLLSTKTSEKAQAETVCDAWAKASRAAKAKRLTPETAREIVGAAIADIYNRATAHSLPNSTPRQWFEQWIEGKKIETEETTVARYEGIVRDFLAHLGAGADRDIATIRADEIERFRNAVAKQKSHATANFSLKVLRTAFNGAMKRGLVQTNQAASVDVLKVKGERVRRPLTMAEIRLVLKQAEDSEWEGIILAGLYTGQRLGDLARLTWGQIDLPKGSFTLTTKKTGKRLELPLAAELQDYLQKLPSSDDPATPIFPKAAASHTRDTSSLSAQFYNLLADVGLVERRNHKGGKKGRAAKRDISPISFHSLRHSAVSFLKAAGVTEAVAMELVGHETAAISQHYTTLDVETKRAAIAKLPRIKEGK